ncbi:MAG: hypothetical protein IJ151_01690 [Bacteroidales bacterium]|nr:hypothetical protein [Bacteroidales bacterium]
MAPVVKTAAEHVEKHVATAVTRVGKSLEPRLVGADIPSGRVSYSRHATELVHKKSVAEAIAGFSGFAVLVRAALDSPLEVGAMALYRVEGLGVYASYMTSIGGVSSSYECASDGATTFGYFWASGKEKKTAMSLSAGAVLPVFNNVEIYAGAGYGSYSLFWEDTSAAWAKVTDKSYGGVFCEAGAVIQTGPFNLIGGIGTIAFKSVIPMAGIGISF